MLERVLGVLTGICDHFLLVLRQELSHLIYSGFLVL